MKTEDIPAFLYKWTDHKNDMYYIGAHKGTPDDGYVCSSKYMKKEYKERPEDFSREILLIGETEYIFEMETKYLQNIDAAGDPQYYNKTNSCDGFKVAMYGEDNPFFGRHHSEEVIDNLRRINTGKKLPESTKKKQSKSLSGENHPLFGKNHKEESKKKISEARQGKYIGEDNPFFGKTHTEESKKRQSLAKKGKKQSKESNEKRSKTQKGKHYKYNPKEILQYSFKEANELFGISKSQYYIIKKRYGN